jgi:hypothetical protein
VDDPVWPTMEEQIFTAGVFVGEGFHELSEIHHDRTIGRKRLSVNIDKEPLF